MFMCGVFGSLFVVSCGCCEGVSGDAFLLFEGIGSAMVSKGGQGG